MKKLANFNSHLHSIFTIIIKYSQSSKSRFLPVSQKAVLAAQIIEIIQTSKNPETINGPILRDLMENIDLNKQGKQNKVIDDEIKNQMMQMFHKGVFLNQNVYSQTRIIGKSEPPIKEYQSFKAEQKKYNFTIYPFQGPFVFYPNYLVTKNIFDVMGKPNLDYFINGGYGISKTVSIIFYIHLSGYINQLHMQAQRDQKIKEELKQLVQKGLVFQRHPKFWYWTIDMNNQRLDIRKLIMEQAVELSPSQKQSLKQCESFDAFTTKICQLYEPIKNIVVVDQINSLVSKMREYNIDYQNYYYKALQLQKNQQIQNKELNEQRKEIIISYSELIEKKTKAQAVHTKFKDFKSLGKHYIINSPVTIENDLLGKALGRPLKYFNYLYLDLIKHNQLQEIQILFQQHLTERWGKIAFLQYMWFQIEKLLLKTIKETKQIKKKFDDFVQSNIQNEENPIICSYYRFLHIRQFIQKDYQNFQNANEDYFKAFSFQQFFQRFRIFISSQLQEKINNHTKHSPSSKCLLEGICFFMEIQVKKADFKQKSNIFNKKFKKSEFSIQKICSFLGIRQSKLKQLLFKPDVDKQHLLFVENRNKIDFLMTPKEFIALAQKTILKTELILQKYFYSQDSLIIKQYKQKSSIRGSIIQYSLMHCFAKGTRVQMQIFQSIKTKPINKSNESSSQKAIIKFNHDKVPFIPFIKRTQYPKKDDSIQENFRQIFQLCKNNQGQWMFGIPGWWKSQTQFLHEPLNPSTDFVMVRYLKLSTLEQGFFQILSFDVTVSANLSEKIRKAKQLYQPFLKDQNRSYSLTHHIVVPEQVIQKYRDRDNLSSSSLIIKLVSLDSLQFKQCPNPQALQTFKMIKNVKEQLAIFYINNQSKNDEDKNEQSVCSLKEK